MGTKRITDKRLGGLSDTLLELYATEKITQAEYRSVMFDLYLAELIELTEPLVQKLTRRIQERIK